MSVKGLKKLYPYYLGNRVVLGSTEKSIPVINKWTNEVATHVSLAEEKSILEAIELGSKAEDAMKSLTSFQRKDILLYVADQLKKREREFAEALVVEVGKPLKDALTECGRAIDTFTIAAEESVRRSGEFLHLDVSVRNKGYTAITDKFPIGLISMIVPFNFPVNLAAHKIAPAIAAGCPFIVKPSDKTPITSSLLGEILAETSLPQGSFSILPVSTEDAHHLSKDERIKHLSFTGSVAVGWKLKQEAGKKKVTLELGGNAGCVVDKDVKNLDGIVDRIVFGAFYSSGQSCISVQRIFVHEEIYDQFKEKFIEKTQQLKKGDPFDETTFLGPVISESDAKRIESWVNHAAENGGKVIAGGKRDGCFYDPTIVENPPYHCELNFKEVFGPVCTLQKFSTFQEAMGLVNDSPFGLQTGIFTRNIHKAFYAFKTLHVGGVVINDIPSARIDAQPYGGVKDSGLGREGVRHAIEDFSEIKIMTMKDMAMEDIQLD